VSTEGQAREDEGRQHSKQSCSVSGLFRHHALTIVFGVHCPLAGACKTTAGKVEVDNP